MIHFFRAIGLPIVLGFFFLGLYVAHHLGLWSSVEIQVREDFPPAQLLYREHLGPYHQIDPVIVEVESWAKDNGLDCSTSFAEFKDNPKAVAEVDLRARGGCVLRPAMPPELLSTLPAEFKTEMFQPAKILEARFRGAPSVAHFKVYPRMDEDQAKLRLLAGSSTYHFYEIKADGSFNSFYVRIIETPPE